ncbi:AMP-binding protein [Streptomyces sp. NPDC005534]|uniref:AMP-binding protein n=1 Tax=Streptomyces sp. NPDC005534 TaxID=3155714 RepID=UPI003451A065
MSFHSRAATGERVRAVPDLIEESAAATPQALAVVHGKRTLSYEELNNRANQVAHLLQQHGAGPEAVVAVCLPSSLELVVAALGVLKSGAAYLPLDPGHAAQSLVRSLAASQATTVLTTLALTRLLTTHTITAIAVDEPLLWHGTANGPGRTHRPGHLAYLVHSPRDSGAPKSVALEHHCLSNLVAWECSSTALTSQDRCALVTSPGFDASMWEMWPPLTVGAALYIPDQATVLSPRALANWLTHTGITVASIPVPLIERLAGVNWSGLQPVLRLLRTGGRRLRVRPGAGIPLRWRKDFSSPDHTATTAAGTMAAHGDPARSRPSHAAGTGGGLLDEKPRTVPSRVHSELPLAMPAPPRSLTDPAEPTDEQAVPSPTGTGSRPHPTEDLVQLLSDGTFELCGPSPGQVPVRGHRVEPAEATAALCSLPEVRSALVRAHEGPHPDDTQLVGYLALDNPEDLSALQRVRWALAATLPDYLLPTGYIVLERLQTDAGSRAPACAPPDASWPRIARTGPRNASEKHVVQVWQEVLGLDDVGIDDGFFDRGGHLLLLADVHERLGRELGRDIPLLSLFEHPTPRALASFLSSSQFPTATAVRGLRTATHRTGGVRLRKQPPTTPHTDATTEEMQ